MRVLECEWLYIEAPGRFLATNDRGKWAKHSPVVKAWREAAKTAALECFPFDGPVSIKADVYKPSRRAYDLDGVVPTIKACIDGLRDAGVLVEDDMRHVTRLIVQHGEVRKPGAIAITITGAREVAP